MGEYLTVQGVVASSDLLSIPLGIPLFPDG